MSLPPLEADIQRDVVRIYTAAGWLAIKLDPGTGSIPKGWPDLMCIGMNRHLFIEMKRGSMGRVEPMQEHYRRLLTLLGQRVVVARTVEEATAPLEEK